MSEILREDIERIISDKLPWDALDGSTVLVTGATGMVGQYLVRTMLELRNARGIEVEVIALARNLGKAKSLFQDCPNELTILNQDVSRSIEIDRKVDVIIHAASPANPAAFKEDPVGVMAANILGSFNTLDLARRNSARYCFISTMEVYGQVPSTDDQEIYVGEDARGDLDWTDLRAAYPESKRSGEALAIAYGQQHGVEYSIARMTHTYGPGMGLDDPRVQAEFLRYAHEGKSIVLKSDGSLRRTYTYISDAIAGVFHVLLSGQDQRIYNIANNDAQISIRELAETVLGVANNDAQLVMEIDEEAARFWSKTRNTYADSSRLRKLGWEAQISPQEGFARTLAFHRGR